MFKVGVAWQVNPQWLEKDSELSGAFMYAPRKSVTGASLFNAFMGGAAGNETTGMRHFSFGLAWNKRF